MYRRIGRLCLLSCLLFLRERAHYLFPPVQFLTQDLKVPKGEMLARWSCHDCRGYLSPFLAFFVTLLIGVGDEAQSTALNAAHPPILSDTFYQSEVGPLNLWDAPYVSGERRARASQYLLDDRGRELRTRSGRVSVQLAVAVPGAGRAGATTVPPQGAVVVVRRSASWARLMVGAPVSGWGSDSVSAWPAAASGSRSSRRSSRCRPHGW